MPRRRALTDAQLENLIALPVIEVDLIRHWTLAAADLAVIERRRGGHNQLGYALQLCAFRYPDRLLRPGEAIPETALNFVANQLRVSASALAAYEARPQTRREQLDGLREGFGFQMYAHGYGREMLAWLLPVALATTNAVTVAATLMDELRRRKILAPGSSVIERLIAAVLVVAERHVAGQLTRNLSPAQTDAWTLCSGPRRTHRRVCWPGHASHPARQATGPSSGPSISSHACAPSASIPPLLTGCTRSGCANLPVRAAVLPPSTCARSRRSVAGRLWSRPCWIPRRG